jgi:hypothetical protein
MYLFVKTLQFEALIFVYISKQNWLAHLGATEIFYSRFPPSTYKYTPHGRENANFSSKSPYPLYAERVAQVFLNLSYPLKCNLIMLFLPKMPAKKLTIASQILGRS